MDLITISIIAFFNLTSVVIGLIGIYRLRTCTRTRVKPAIYSIQILAIMLAVLLSVLVYQYHSYINETILVYLALNCAFFLLVQTSCHFLTCYPVRRVKRRVIVKSA